jgi:hypothetical protein
MKHEVSKKKMKRINWIIFFAIVIIGALIVTFMLKKPLHENIAANDVAEILLWGNGNERLADEKEIKEIVGWFNDIKDVRENKEMTGTTPPAGIIITMNNGKQILVLRSGDEFEVQREDVAYWAREEHLKNLLNQLAGIHEQ